MKQQLGGPLDVWGRGRGLRTADQTSGGVSSHTLPTLVLTDSGSGKVELLGHRSSEAGQPGTNTNGKLAHYVVTPYKLHVLGSSSELNWGFPESSFYVCHFDIIYSAQHVFSI